MLLPTWIASFRGFREQAARPPWSARLQCLRSGLRVGWFCRKRGGGWALSKPKGKPKPFEEVNLEEKGTPISNFSEKCLWDVVCERASKFVCVWFFSIFDVQHIHQFRFPVFLFNSAWPPVWFASRYCNSPDMFPACLPTTSTWWPLRLIKPSICLSKKTTVVLDSL